MSLWDSFDVTNVPEVQTFVRIQKPAAGASQEEPMPHTETIVTIDPIAPARPGESIHVTGLVTGIDGSQGEFIVYANYPQRDGATNWGQYGKAVIPSKDGPFGFDIQLGEANYPFDAPLNGTMEIRSLELTPSANPTADNWGEQPIFTAPFLILPAAQAQAAPQPQTAPAPVSPAVPAALPAEYDPLYKLAGDLAAYGDVDKQLAVYFQQVIKWRKGEPDGINPFSTPRR